MYGVRIFDASDRENGHTSNGALVALAYDANACAVLVASMEEDCTIRCTACEWPVWTGDDWPEYCEASHSARADLIESRMSAHAHAVHIRK